MIMTLGFTNGFQYTISQKVFNLWGNIRVQGYSPTQSGLAEEIPKQKNDTVLRALQGNREIKTIQAFATKNAVVRNGEGIQYVLLKGVEKGYDFRNLQGFLKSGRWLEFKDSGYSNGIVLSTYTAGQLKIKPGDKVLIYFIQSNGPPARGS